LDISCSLDNYKKCAPRKIFKKCKRYPSGTEGRDRITVPSRSWDKGPVPMSQKYERSFIMWKKKLCLGTSDCFGMSTTDQIKTFAKIGFDGFFTGWRPDDPIDEWVRTAKDTGMIYQSIHAPFGGSADMWGEDTDSG